jgi:hypothetical protein
MVPRKACQEGSPNPAKMVPKKAKNCGNKSLPEWGKQKRSNEGLSKNGTQKCPPKVFAQKHCYT